MGKPARILAALALAAFLIGLPILLSYQLLRLRPSGAEQGAAPGSPSFPRSPASGNRSASGGPPTESAPSAAPAPASAPAGSVPLKSEAPGGALAPARFGASGSSGSSLPAGAEQAGFYEDEPAEGPIGTMPVQGSRVRIIKKPRPARAPSAPEAERELSAADRSDGVRGRGNNTGGQLTGSRIDRGSHPPGDAERDLEKANETGAQAARMSQKLHLLDGAKDHAGKKFDGNSKLRKGIPIDTYSNVFGQKSLKAQETGTVDFR